jgi:hypothetical protein
MLANASEMLVMLNGFVGGGVGSATTVPQVRQATFSGVRRVFSLEMNANAMPVSAPFSWEGREHLS